MKNCMIGSFVLCMGLALGTQAATVSTVENLVEAVQNGERWVDIWPGTYDLGGRETMTAPDGTKAYLVVTAANCVFKNAKSNGQLHWSARDPANEVVIKGGTAARLVYCYGSGRGTQFQHVTFEGGNAGTDGNGGVIAFSGIGKGSATNCVFRGASAANGGATYGLTATDCLFTNNTASANGGGAVGFAAEGLTNAFVNCVFADNRAANGGGLYCQNYFQSVKGCVFTNNAATANGGGLYVAAKIDVLTATIFDGNRAGEGGALYANAGLASATGCTFSNGVSDGQVGGVYLKSYGGAFNGCLFESNTNKTATVDGSHVNNAQSAMDCIFRGWGDLRVQRFSRCTFDRCVYFAGEGSAEDGLITFVSWREAGTIENCLFAGCSTSVLIYNKSNKTVPIVNCTFADNTLRHWGKHDGFLFFAHRADAGMPSTNVIVNSIFSGNRVATESSAASGESVPCDFMANATTYKVESSPCLNLVSNAVYVTYDAVYSKNNPTQFSKFRKVADVGFVGMSDPALPPYALRKGSRAINRGLNAGWTAEDTDLSGNSRVQGQAVDLGCYESPFDWGLVLVVR